MCGSPGKTPDAVREIGVFDARNPGAGYGKPMYKPFGAAAHFTVTDDYIIFTLSPQFRRILTFSVVWARRFDPWPATT